MVGILVVSGGLLAGSVLGVGGAAIVRAEGNLEGVTTAGIQLGPHVSGPQVTADTLANRVVLLEFWGINCPPCIASMPKLEELSRKLGPSGLVVIGAHAQGGPPEKIAETARELGVTFTIVERATVTGGMDFAGIPHCMLFDHTGKCVFRGSPFEVHDRAVAAVQAAPAAILAGRDLVKLADLTKLLRDEAAFGVVWKKAAGLTKAADETLAEEARYVVERLEERAEQMLDEARGAKDSDPLAASQLLQRCQLGFRGTAPGNEAADMLRKWRGEKAFRDGVRAGEQLERLRQMRAFVLQAAGGAEAGSPEIGAALPPPMRRKMEAVIEAIQRSSPGSRPAAEANRIATEFGFNGSESLPVTPGRSPPPLAAAGVSIAVRCGR